MLAGSNSKTYLYVLVELLYRENRKLLLVESFHPAALFTGASLGSLVLFLWYKEAVM